LPCRPRLIGELIPLSGKIGKLAGSLQRGFVCLKMKGKA
jgi:hypothetical protein